MQQHLFDNKRSSIKYMGPLMSRGMKGMMGGSSLATVSRYARWFLDGSCGKSHTDCELGQEPRQRRSEVQSQLLQLAIKFSNSS